MKTKNFIPLAMISAALFSLSLAGGCKKDDSSKEDDITTNADQFQEAEGVSTDVDAISDQAVQLHSVTERHAAANEYNLLTCATVTRDTITQVITVDFGTGCTGNDGRLRSGQIIIHYQGGTYFTPGFQRTVTFNNYYVSSRHIEGTRTIVNNGDNAAGHLNWSINAQNMRVTRPGGEYHQWNSQRVREMISGDTLLGHPQDDVYSITGSSSGINSNGNSCSATITTPLIREGTCHYIVSGTVVITPSNRPQRTLDFGNGGCDQYATVTMNGTTHTLTLH